VKVPHGFIEDVLVKVDEFYFPVDFIVLDMESTRNPTQIHIILGRPFLAMANTCINCRTSVMDISFENKKVKPNIFIATQGPNRDEDCFAIELIDLIDLRECGRKFTHSSQLGPSSDMSYPL